MLSLQNRYEEICNRIRLASGKAGRKSGPQLIAVSKTQPLEAIEELYHLGHRDFGENYAQELVEKAKDLSSRGCSEIRWHFIGHLQTNKVKMILPWVSAIHTVDSIRIADEISKRWTNLGRSGKFSVFVEVNLDQEVSKSGFKKEAVAQAVRDLQVYSNLEVQGLMCIPSPQGDTSLRFRELKQLKEDCAPMTQGMLSMGMSDDYEAAIQEGSTHIRIGTALFGPRRST